MSDVKHNCEKYHKTGQFSDVIQHVRRNAQFKGLDDNGEPIIDRSAVCPKIKFRGTVKLHGTNASVIQFEDQAIYKQSKERILCAEHDNYGFFALTANADVSCLLEQVKARFVERTGLEVKYPVKIAGEWAGQGVQTGMGISNYPKTFYTIGIKIGDNKEDGYGWQPLEDYADISIDGFVPITNFPVYEVEVDFENPKDVQNYLGELTLDVEKVCPVAAQLGTEGLGEGIVWTPVEQKYLCDTGMWFKVKGEKHSASKVKTLAAVDPAVLASIKEFVEYACTENRMNQAIQEVGLDVKKTGEYIGWVNRDIAKEELHSLAASGLTMKDVGSPISDKARRYYFEQINKAN